MATKHVKFDGAIPEIYDSHLGPLLFHHYATDLAGRIHVATGGRVLETACGTGNATEKLRAVLSDDVEIIATDLNDAMLAIAGDKRGDLANVTYRQADALSLPFEDNSFDAVACQFGIMFFPDKDAGAREALRVLKPGGVFAFNVWGSFETNPAMRIAHETISGFFTENPPSFLKTPFGFYRTDPIDQLLRDAGFGAIEIETVDTVVERPSAHHVAVGAVEGNPGIHEIDDRATADRETVVEAVAQALCDSLGDAPLRVPMQAIVITAKKPEG